MINVSQICGSDLKKGDFAHGFLSIFLKLFPVDFPKSPCWPTGLCAPFHRSHFDFHSHCIYNTVRQTLSSSYSYDDQLSLNFHFLNNESAFLSDLFKLTVTEAIQYLCFSETCLKNWVAKWVQAGESGSRITAFLKVMGNFLDFWVSPAQTSDLVSGKIFFYVFCCESSLCGLLGSYTFSIHD